MLSKSSLLNYRIRVKHNACEKNDCKGKKIWIANHNRTEKIYYADIKKQGKIKTVTGSKAKSIYSALKKTYAPGNLVKNARR